MKEGKEVPARFLAEGGRIDASRIKDEASIARVARDATDLKPSGSELRGLCPLHDEKTPSFFVNEAKGVFHCHGCDAGGDVIELQRRITNSDFRQACLDLVGALGGGTDADRRLREDPLLLETRRAEAVRRAREMWRRAGDAEGTVVETYLITRAIGHSIPGSIRHVLSPRWWYHDGREGRREPAMLAAVQDRDGRVGGVVRTFLTREGRKSPVGAPRLSLGRIRGGAVRLGPVAETVMLAAGIEDALAVRLMFPGCSAWTAPGDGNLPHVRFPFEVRRVVVCGDSDEPGRVAALAAVAAYRAAGLEAEPLLPRAGAKDFSEEWLLLHA